MISLNDCIEVTKPFKNLIFNSRLDRLKLIQMCWYVFGYFVCTSTVCSFLNYNILCA